MSFSGKTTDLILQIKDFSDGKIKNDFDLSVLLEAGYFTDKKPLFEDLIFKAKFLYGMMNIFSGNPSREHFEKLIPEFGKNLEDFIGLLKNITGDGNDTITKAFSEKYFTISPDVMQELANLISDLSLCKDYINEMKYNRN
jgi:hypothetical protein